VNSVNRAIGPLVTVVGLSVLLLAAPGPARSQPAGCERQLEADPHVYLGGWIPGALDDPRLALAQDPLGQTNAIMGKPMAIVNRWEHWGLENDGGVDGFWMQRVARAGAIPMYTWDPWNPDTETPDFQQGFLPRDIAAGRHDAYIASVADELADWDGPVFVRFAQEMNGTWYPWGRHQNTPEEFVAAWRHVHEIVTGRGGEHVTWVWNPSEKHHTESTSLWYPGDDVVDWVAVDGYNWDDWDYWRDRSNNTWRMMDQVFSASFADIAGFAGADKPRMIAETASTERPGDPELKAAWICDAFLRALPEELPEVRAVVWFQEEKYESDRPFFWPLDTSPSSAEAFAAAVAPPYYVGGASQLPMALGRHKITPP
jgi:hypothetical protein